MAKSKSSKKWLAEHASDIYVKRAKQQGLRARSAFKLMEIQNKHKLIKTGMTVIDLGAAPGSWSEYTQKLIGETGKIIAVDILPIKPIPGVILLQGDITSEETIKKLFDLTNNSKIDIIISDMAPNISGIADVDKARAELLLEIAFDFARKVLKPGGTLLLKTFLKNNINPILSLLRGSFADVKVLKPQASRARSSEIFLLAKNFKS